jgi:2-dehydro-3-deoxygluconokinase
MSPLIVSIGEPLIEFNQTRPGQAGETRGYLRGFGGDSSNMIVAAARSGARTAYVTRLGDDEYGRLFLELWRAEGVDASGVGIDPLAPTGAYYVSHGPQGHAFRYERAGSAASRLRPQDLPRELIAGADFVHASGISLAISPSAAESVQSAYAAARAAGAMISFDANLRPALWPIERARPMIAAAAGAADYFFLSIEEAMPLSGLRSDADGESVLDWAHRLGARTVFLKLGAAGAWVSNGGRREHIAGMRVAAVDATGAGDCFCGAALARLAAGDDVFAAARYANAAAALATTGFGAVDPLPRAAAVAEILASA